MKVPWKKSLFLIYVTLLVLSWIFQDVRPLDVEKRSDQEDVLISAITEESDESEDILIRYVDTGLGENDKRPVLLMLHGSPMASLSFDAISTYLNDYRLIIPDLPGFGRSQKEVRSYSIKSHAVAMEAFLELLDIDEAHVLGYSMGGGVALEMLSIGENRIQSLILLSSIGVQEYELLGDYSLNHSIHAAQLFAFKLFETFVPHFGYMDQLILNSRYARNFYDTDQRPLEQILRNYDGPAIILHGNEDALVPVEAAKEHARLLPQAILKLYEAKGHVFLMTDPDRTARDIKDFVDQVNLSSEELIRGNREIEGEPIPRKNKDGVVATLLALATFVSEDLACVGAGLLAAKGGVSLGFAIFGTFAGIFIGDFLIFLAGRMFGMTALRVPPFKWMLNENKIGKGAKWFNEKGIVVVIVTRFIPGSRVITYFSAGVVKANTLSFALALAVAAGIWTPILVSLSYYFGGNFLQVFEESGGSFLISALLVVVVLVVCVRLTVSCATWKGRRLLYSKFQRLIRWEFWPMWALYPPVIIYIAWLMLRYRSITLCTALNPCMLASGLVYESKSQILGHLRNYKVPIGRFELLELEASVEKKLEKIKLFIDENDLDYPIVLKPDVGQRGQGVSIVRSNDEAREFLRIQSEDTIVQEFIGGEEYGVFYYRMPGQEKGKVMSVTDKRFTSVSGDGFSNLETLILRDARAVLMAAYFLEKFDEKLEWIPEKNEEVVLADLGTHSKGALFLDGESLITPELEAAIDEFSGGIDGFYFGRYDIRVPSEKHLKRGEGIRVIELNGMTSESTNMYDPKHGLSFAYRVLLKQWSLIFRISVENRKRGVQPDSLGKVFGLIYGYLSGKTVKELPDSSR
ncbi:alpha/beta fold hydrolase [Puniceicoccaceae bacterium K14]|nr:alpha/beta fold hydrolase [Puniceicoccaceae bacterium K14]